MSGKKARDLQSQCWGGLRGLSLNLRLAWATQGNPISKKKKKTQETPGQQNKARKREGVSWG
jgi:hypothetical protein